MRSSPVYYSQTKSGYKNHTQRIWSQIALSDEQKNPRDIMNKADNRNSTL